MKCASLYLFLLFSLLHGFANGQKYNFQNFTTNEGLASNESYYSLQGEDGYMYISTDRGLQRFDGKEFSTVPFEDYSLNGSTVFKIVQDYSNTLWVSTYKKGLFFIENDTLRPFKHNDKLLKILRFSFVEQFFFDQNQHLYFSIMRGLPQVYVANTEFELDSVGYKELAPANLRGLKRVFIKDTHVVSKIQLSNPNCPPTKRVMHSFTVKSKQAPQHRDISPRGGPSVLSGDSLLTAISHILVIYSKKGEYINEIDLQSQILWIMVDSNKHILVGTLNGFFRIGNQGLFEHCLDGYLVNCITQDKEKGYWINTTTHGLFYLPSFGVKTLSYGHRIAGINTHENHLVISDHSRFLSTYRITNSLPQKDTVIRIPKWSKAIYVNQDSIGVTGKRFHLENGKITSHSNGFQEAKDYIQFNDSLIIAAQIDGAKFIRFDNPRIRDPLIDSTYSSMALFGDDKYIYIGTVAGLLEYNKFNGKYRDLLKNAQSQIITDIEALNDSTLLACSKTNGIFVLNSDRIEQINASNSTLLSSGCSSLAIENDSTFWVGTDLGIAQINRHQNGKWSCRNFGKDDGLLSQKVNDLAMMGNLLFVGTDMGCCYFDVSKIEWLNSPIKLLVKAPNTEYSRFENDTIWLKKGVRDLVLNFNTISFKHRQHLSYSYTVQGKQTVNSPSNIFYINSLKPGNNSIAVNVANSNGHWSSSPLQLVIVSPPYLYERTSFKITATLTGLLIIVGLIYLYLTYHYRKKLRKWKMSTLQLRELNLQLNPHFIFNSINNLHNLALHGEKKEISDFISLFSGFTRKVLDNSRFKMISVKEEMDNLNTYIELERLRFKEHPFEFNLELAETINLENELVPPMILQPVVENSIWHGLLPKQGKKTLSIKLSSIKNGMEICIQDNGIGLTQSQQAKSETVHKSSVGLSNTRMRLELYEEMDFGKAKFELKEAKNEDGKINGVMAIFRFFPNRAKISII